MPSALVEQVKEFKSFTLAHISAAYQEIPLPINESAVNTPITMPAIALPDIFLLDLVDSRVEPDDFLMVSHKSLPEKSVLQVSVISSQQSEPQSVWERVRDLGFVSWSHDR
jgi:hypothetical protein